MRRFYSVPLLFLFLAAVIGLFLRWQFIEPTPGINYTFFLHAHSHVMFLGWVFNVFYLSFTDYHLAGRNLRPLIRLFLLFQTLVVAMMISFPIQGYGMYSIIFSTLHTIAAMVFIVIFFRMTRGQGTASAWFARMSLFFFFLSTAGPFSLGYLMATGLGGTVWYNFSIYYYLHFQYNGFFLFGVLSLFYQLLERKNIVVNKDTARTIGRWLAIACVPAYFLSTLFADPGWFFNALGALAAVLQLLVLGILRGELKRLYPALKTTFKPIALLVLKLAFAGLVIKSLLQLFSAHPEIALLTYQLRPVVIAYLHLVLLGVITFFLLAWYVEMSYVRERPAQRAFWILFAGFIGSEICLVIMPWWRHVFGAAAFPTPAVVIFSLSVLLMSGILLFYQSSQQKS